MQRPSFSSTRLMLSAHASQLMLGDWGSPPGGSSVVLVTAWAKYFGRTASRACTVALGCPSLALSCTELRFSAASTP